MEKNFPQISLKAARVNRDFSQQEAAERLHIHRSTLQKYESGQWIPPWETIGAMESLYGIHKDFLFLGKKTAKSGQKAS